MSEPSALAAALVEALKDLSVVDKNATADAGSYKYDYADIAEVVKLTRPKLAEHGIVALTPITEHANGLACTVILLHTSGDRLDLGPFPFPVGRDAQATGSMVTYHRRYALLAALGMAAGADDDDGARGKPYESAAPPKFDLARFLKACKQSELDPTDVLAFAEISKPLEELTNDDRPGLLAAIKALAKSEGGAEQRVSLENDVSDTPAPPSVEQEAEEQK